jgi:hypothetical protein
VKVCCYCQLLLASIDDKAFLCHPGILPGNLLRERSRQMAHPLPSHSTTRLSIR